MDELGSFLEYLEKVRGRTLRVVKCIPPDKIEWTYAKGKFTLGDLVRHLASIERYMFVENALGRSSRYPGHGKELADGYENVLAYFIHKHEESVSELKKLTPEQWKGKCRTPDGAEISTWKWLRAMIEHEIHHRGQIYLYLAMLGVRTPPLYGLTEEEVKAKSAG